MAHRPTLQTDSNPMAYAPVIWIKFYLKPPEISDFVAVLNIVFSHIDFIILRSSFHRSAIRNKIELIESESTGRNRTKKYFKRYPKRSVGLSFADASSRVVENLDKAVGNFIRSEILSRRMVHRVKLAKTVNRWICVDLPVMLSHNIRDVIILP